MQTNPVKPPLRRRLRNRWQALRNRLVHAWHVLRAPHFIVYFDYQRPIPSETVARGMNGGWRGVRRQDVYDVGHWCLQMLAEDDEANNLVDDANDLLNN